MIVLIILFACAVVACKEPFIRYPEGGHNFPISVADADTNNYFYPYKDSGTVNDSFLRAEGYQFYRAFGEKNLSIKPSNEAVFRLSYGGWLEQPVVINLTLNQIVVKEGRGQYWMDEDTNRLAPLERWHLQILEANFPLNDTNHSKRKQHRLDSLAHLYPQLLNPTYYHSLLYKARVPPAVPFSYTVKKIPIATVTFRHFVNLFSESGYWRMPERIIPCIDGASTDASGFLLEANTGKKYQCINIIVCPGDTTGILAACQELLKYAKMDKKINLIENGESEMMAPPVPGEKEQPDNLDSTKK